FSARPKTANFPDYCVGLQILILKILNVFLRLKFSPALYSKKFSGFRSDTSISGVSVIPGQGHAHLMVYWERAVRIAGVNKRKYRGKDMLS
ncbi:MAG: hypothetical protein ABIJ31_14055, partial [Pseudomonadota bacterium]